MKDDPLEKIHLEQLRVLNLVIALGNMTKAGDELGKSEAQISKDIRTLAKQYGVRLVDKRRNGAQPTEAALALNEYGRQAARLAEQIKLEMAIFGSSNIPKLRIGYSRSHVRTVASAIVSVREREEFAFPPKITAEELEPRKAIALLKAEVLDIALVHGEDSFTGIREIEVGESHLEAVFHIKHEQLGELATINADELSDVPLALFQSGPVRDRINKLFGTRKPQNIVLESNSRTLLIEFVRAEPDAVTILAGPSGNIVSHRSQKTSTGNLLKYCPLEPAEKLPTRLLHLASHEPSKVTAAFIEEVKRLLPATPKPVLPVTP